MLTSYRAVLPGVALLCSVIAFILALCCLLAGTNPDTLQHMELYTFNTSKIAATLIRDMHLPPSNGSFNITTLIPRDGLNSTLSNAENGIDNIGKNLASDAGDFAKDPSAAVTDLKNNITQSVDQAKQQVSDAVSKAESALQNATGEIVSAFINETIQTFHVHDFYIGHLLTYCEGNYTAKGKENVTFCSNHKPNNKYNSTTAGNSSNAKGNNDPFAFIEDLHLPDPAEYGLKALTLLTKVISTFYIVGIIALFFSLLSSGLTIPAYFAPPTAIAKGGGKRTLLRWASLLSSSCAFFTLLLASTMVHFLVKNVCELFNEHPGIGVAAYPGQTFLGCSWASVIITAFAMGLAVVDVGFGIVTNKARNRLGGAAEKRKWWGKGSRDDKEYEL